MEVDFSSRSCHPTKESSEDRISTLPDDVLLEILQRLSDDLCSIVRVGALSRRRTNLPRMLPALKLDARDITRPDNAASGHNNSCTTVDQIMAAYTATARWLLLNPTTTRRVIKKCIDLVFFLRDPYLHSIGQAVESAVGDGTEELDLTVQADIAAAALTDEHSALLGRRFASFFEACPVVFRWLTRLTLEDCLSGPNDIPTLVNTCDRLRFLELRHCDVIDDSVMKIDAPRSQLVCLKLHCCNFRRVDLIRVPKLRRVYCDTWIGDSPPEPFVLSEWLSNARSLSILYLNFRGQKIWVTPEDPKLLSPLFSNLRDVHLRNIFQGCDLNWTLSFLEAAPFLNNFYISLCRHTCETSKSEDSAEKTNVPWEASSFKHHNLRLLEMKGFKVERRVMQYLRLVIQRAVCLKRICLLENDPCMECDSVKHQSLLPKKRSFNAETRNSLIRARLKDGLSSYVEISIG
uniref:At1g61320/AtMIF1 LRR domain-containing protein n=1 Tax=Leersia perrieri TaxID=77586 RepID=A0A0D9W811_9ORYZ